MSAFDTNQYLYSPTKLSTEWTNPHLRHTGEPSSLCPTLVLDIPSETNDHPLDTMAVAIPCSHVLLNQTHCASRRNFIYCTRTSGYTLRERRRRSGLRKFGLNVTTHDTLRRLALSSTGFWLLTRHVSLLPPPRQDHPEPRCPRPQGHTRTTTKHYKH